MMTIINIYKAKTNLSKIVQQVINGEEIVIAKAGKPLVKLSVYQERKIPRRAGSQKGKIKIMSDFDKLPKKIIDSFYNSKL